MEIVSVKYIQSIANTFGYELREQYLYKLINEFNDKKINKSMFNNKYKIFQERLEDFLSELKDLFSCELVINGNMYYNSNGEYEQNEVNFGLQVEDLSLDFFGKEIKLLLPKSVSLTISANKKGACVKVKKLKNGRYNTTLKNIENECEMSR